MSTEKLTQKFKDLFSGGEDRGVSPVIGVILMVAITVVLAAVIAAAVMGIGGDIGGSTAPNTVLSVDSENASASDGTSYAYNINIEHTQGDSIEQGDLRIILRSSADENLGTIDNLEDDTLSLGDTKEVSIPEGNINEDGTTNVAAIDIVHVPSDSVITSSSVDF